MSERKEKQRLLLASPHMSEEGYEMEYIKEAFATNWIAPLGKNVEAFEREICEKTGAKAAVALSSGTAALHLALKLAGVGRGDLVLCSTLTFAATANPIIYEGAEPVFIDSERETWNMSPAALQKAFEKYEALGRRPKAVIFVHLYGIAADVEGILRVCREYGCAVIEDAAESLGTIRRVKRDIPASEEMEGIGSGTQKYTGSFGDYGIYSFNGNKIITSSGGGMLLCNTKAATEKAEKARFWATQAREPVRWYEHREIGYNYRMSNVVAGIGRGQLRVLEKRIRKKQEIYAYYQRELKGLEGLWMMPVGEVEKSNCWLSVMETEEGCISPLEIIEGLERENIESRRVWKPLHLQPVFGGYDYVTREGESVSEAIFRRGVCLPSDTKLAEEELKRICGVIKELWREAEKGSV